MKVLALETATDACSAALILDGVLTCRHELAPRRHAEILLPMVQELLAEAGAALNALDGIAFGRGPGSFTGVRIAASVAQGLAVGADLAVAPVSTLRALAQGARRELGAERVLAAFDARMNEVYWGAYTCDEDGFMVLRGEESVCPPAAVPVPAPGTWHGVGSGWEVHGEAMSKVVPDVAIGAPGRFPHAIDVAQLGVRVLVRGKAVAPEQALPVYLRDRVTHRPSS